MGDVVGLVDLDGAVVVAHGSTKVVLMVAGEGTLDVEGCVTGLLGDGAVEGVFGLGAAVVAKEKDGFHAPCGAVVGVELDGVVYVALGEEGVLLHDGDFGFHGVVGGVGGPKGEDAVEGVVGAVELLGLNHAVDHVVP